MNVNLLVCQSTDIRFVRIEYIASAKVKYRIGEREKAAERRSSDRKECEIRVERTTG